MKIKNIKVNAFGKLKNKEIILTDNVNIISGKNEAGKSSLLKFILAMFYGISKNKNGKTISDYEKYTPWETEEFSGKIAYELDNKKRFEIFRNFKKKNPQIFNDKLEDISNEFSIDKTKGNQFFIEQAKLDEDLFVSTIVSEQNEVKLNKQAQSTLIQKIANILGTGEDNVSYNKIINKLNKRQLEEVGTDRSQDRPINNIKNRIEEVKSEIEFLESYKEQQYQIEENSKQYESDLKKYQTKLEALKELNKLEEKTKIEKEKLLLNLNLEKEYTNKIENLKQQIKNIPEKNKELNNKNIVFKIAIFIIGLIINVVTYLFLNNNITAIILSAILGIYGIYVIYSIFKHIRNKKEIEKSIEESKQNNRSIKNEIEILEQSIKNQKEVNKTIQANIDNTINLESIEIQKKYNIDLDFDIVNILNEIDILQNKVNELKIKIHTLDVDKNNILPKLDNLVSLKEEFEELMQQYKELQYKNEAITLAKVAVQNAYEKMKESVTPKFTEKLSECINRISDGKYKNVRINDEYGIIVEKEDGNYIDAENLSIGTIDQLYLSLRLATINDLSEEKLPIMLDEAFAYYDDERLANILNYICSEYRDRQIIIFTCTSREKEALNSLKINYNNIEL